MDDLFVGEGWAAGHNSNAADDLFGKDKKAKHHSKKNHTKGKDIRRRKSSSSAIEGTTKSPSTSRRFSFTPPSSSPKPENASWRRRSIRRVPHTDETDAGLSKEHHHHHQQEQQLQEQEELVETTAFLTRHERGLVPTWCQRYVSPIQFTAITCRRNFDWKSTRDQGFFTAHCPAYRLVDNSSVLYTVIVKSIHPTFVCDHRYSDFHQLEKDLCAVGVNIGKALPPKAPCCNTTLMSSFTKAIPLEIDAEFLDRRQQGLNLFLIEVLVAVHQINA